MRIALALLASGWLSADGVPDLPIAGRYVSGNELSRTTVDLAPDGRYEDHMVEFAPGSDRPVLEFRTHGVWHDLGDGRLRITNVPTTPPRFEQTSAMRDPAVRAAIDVTIVGSRPADYRIRIDDGVQRWTEPGGSTGWSMPLAVEQRRPMHAGSIMVPTRLPRRLTVERVGDDRGLATLILAAGGPNRVAFRYAPSPINIFRFELRRAGDGLDMDVGEQPLHLRRTGPSGTPSPDAAGTASPAASARRR